MPEWLYEAGIGENRAALVAGGRILEMAVERDDARGPRAGSVLTARLARRADASGRGLALLPDGSTGLLSPVPPELTEGAGFMVEVMREPIAEASRIKPAQVRPTDQQSTSPGPDLLARIAATDCPVVHVPPASTMLDDHGWSEALEEAMTGLVTRPDVQLHIALTPAMTLIDVDGSAAAPELARAGAHAAGEAIRRFGIAGSIGIDLPTLGSKADRQAAAAALDAVLPPPFERTAINGFGFLQIVRRRARMSLIELLAADRVRAAAAALLRQGERAGGFGPVTLHAQPSVIDRISARPDWIELLARRIGASVALHGDDRLTISAHHASRAQS